jgi:hypothetical protein
MNPNYHGYKTRFGQIASCRVHCPSGGGNLALSHCGGIEKEWEASSCMDFQNLNVAMKNDYYPLPFTREILDMVVDMKSINFWMTFRGISR